MNYIATALLLLSLLVGSGAYAFVDGFTPLKSSERPQFRLKLLAENELFKDSWKLPKSSKGITLSLNDDSNLEISGLDNSGKSWTVVKEFSGLGYKIYQGDLDCNGVDDLVLAAATGGCGMAPTTVLSFLLFDSGGRPHFFEMAGYSGMNNDRSVENLIRLKDGHCALVQESMVFNHVGERDFSYFRTLLYRADRAGFHLLGSYGGADMPLLTRFRFHDNHILVKPVPFNLQKFEDVSTDWAFRPAVVADMKRSGENLDEITLTAGAATYKLPGDWNQSLCGYTPMIIKKDADNFVCAAWGTIKAGTLLKEAGPAVMLSVSPRGSKQILAIDVSR